MIIHYHIIEYHIILHIIHTSLLWFDLESKEHSLEMSWSSLCCFDAFSCELMLVLNKQLNETCVLRQKQRGILSEVVRMHEADEIKACNLGQLHSCFWIHWSYGVILLMMDHMNSWKARNLLGKGEAMLSQWNVQPASESQVSWSIHFADEWNCMKSFR